MSGRPPEPAVCRAVLTLVCSAAALTACSGSLFRSRTPPAAVYLLSADLGSAAVSARPVIPADVAVLRPRVRAGLETDRIALLYPDHRLDYVAEARWSGPLDVVVQDLALQALRTGARLRTVSAEASAFMSAYWLELEVADFEAEYSGSSVAPVIRVHLLSRLGRGGDRRTLATFESEVSRPASANRRSAIVKAYQDAAAAALADVVADVVQSVGEGAGPAAPAAQP